MAASKTSLSAGAIVREILLNDTDIAGKVNKIYPIAIDEAKLPYILYRRSGLDHEPTKSGTPASDTIKIEVFCYTDNYADGIELAELVRAALDYKQYQTEDGQRMRSCTLVDAEETWEDDAYVQQLTFNIKI